MRLFCRRCDLLYPYFGGHASNIGYGRLCLQWWFVLVCGCANKENFRKKNRRLKKCAEKNAETGIRSTVDGNTKQTIFTMEAGDHRCPLCSSPIRWACPGNSGYAYCSMAPDSTRVFRVGYGHLLDFCIWEGKVLRRPNGKIEIYYYP